MTEGGGVDRRLLGDVARQDQDRDAAAGDGGLGGDVQDPGGLAWAVGDLGVVAALREPMLGVGCLEEVGADLRRRDVARDGQDLGAAAVGVVEALDEVGVAGAAGRRADGEPAGEAGLGGGGEGGGLLVVDREEGDLPIPADGVGDGVEAVPHEPVDALHPKGLQVSDELVGDGGLGHARTSWE